MADAARDVGTLLVTKSYTGDGAQDTFSAGKNLHRLSSYRVQVKNTSTLHWDIKVEGTDYTVSGTDIVFTAAPALGAEIEIVRETERLNHNNALPNISVNLPPSLTKIAKQSNLGQVNTSTLTAALALQQELEDQQIDDSVGVSILQWQAAITAAAVRHDSTSMITSHLGVDEPSLFYRVDVTLLHNHTGSPAPPSDWLLKLFVVDTPGATPKEMGRFAVNFSGATALQNTDYQGNWKHPSSGNDVQIPVDPGQQWYLTFTGSSADYLLGSGRIGRRRRSPYVNP